MSYFQIDDRLSQSRLKKILVHPRMFLSKTPAIEEDEKIHFVIGSAVDCLLTEREKFNDIYYVIGSDSPTGQLKLFLDNYHSTNNLDSAFKATDSKKFDLEHFKSKMEEETSKTYLNALALGKTLIDYKSYETITQVVASFNNFPNYRECLTKTPDRQIITQLEIMWEYENVPMKSKLDVVVIDFSNRTILPIDIKTTGDSTSAFQYAIWKRRYDIQAVCYDLALKQWLTHPENMSTLKGFTVLPFAFLVESTRYQGSPLMYTLSSETYNIGLQGGVTSEGKTYEGLKQAIERYKWHTDNNLWDYTMEQYSNNLNITI